MGAAKPPTDYSDLKALFFNGTLKLLTAGKQHRGADPCQPPHHGETGRLHPGDPDSGPRHSQRRVSRHGEYGWETDEWPQPCPAVQEADIRFTIPPQADAGWIGPVGPGPSYLDEGSGGPESDFTNRNTTFMTWNLLHLARMLRDAGGIPAYGNLPEEWKAGSKYGFENPPG